MRYEVLEVHGPDEVLEIVRLQGWAIYDHKIDALMGGVLYQSAEEAEAVIAALEEMEEEWPC